MKHLAIIVFLLISSTVYAQDDTGYPENYVPVSIADAIHYLNRTWSEEDKEILRNMDNTISLHHGTGMGIRNSWGFWKKEKNSLVIELESYGVYHPDDKSSIILSLFHKKITDPKFDIKKELSIVKEEYEELRAQEVEFEHDIKQIYESLSVGDIVRVPFGVMNIGGNLTFIMYFNQSGFGYDDFECIVTGTIKKKNQNYSLTIEINDVWFKNEENASQNISKKVGDIFDYEMRDCIIITK